MKKTLLISGLILSTFGLWAQDCSDLFFSEYIEGSGNNKGLEIYNPTWDIIDLSAYYVARFSNGGFSSDDGGTTQLQGFLPAHETHFFVNGQIVDNPDIGSPACDPALQALAQQLDHVYPAPTYMNGNDAIVLFKDLVGNGEIADFTMVDLFGIIAGGMTRDDEGWTDFTDAWTYKNIYNDDGVVTSKDSVYITNYIVPEGYYWLPWTSNHTLIRKPSVTQGIKSNPADEFVVSMEWDTATGGSNVWDSIGFHECDCIYSGILGKVENDVLSVYPNPAVGYFQLTSELPMEAISLYDASGRKVYGEILDSNISFRRVVTENLSSGIYYVKVNMPGRVQSKKLLITR